MTKDYLTRQFELFYNKLPKTDPTSIQDAVNDYLDKHPVEGIGTMTKEEMLAILRGGENA